MHTPFRLTLRCETLLGLAPAAVPRLDCAENPRTWLGPEFFSNLLALFSSGLERFALCSSSRLSGPSLGNFQLLDAVE